MSVWLFTICLVTLSLSVCSTSEYDHDCEVLVSEPWPIPYIIVPQDSTIIINCTADGENPFWSIDLANDSVSTQLQFSTRQDLLNAHGVYELPQLETPGMPPTLRLLINDTEVNNQTEIFCNGNSTSIDITLFIADQNLLSPEILAMGEQFINVSWSQYSMSALSQESTQAMSQTHYILTIAHDSSTDTEVISLNESYYYFTAPEDAPPCEVYNFSVTATYVGALYTGVDCGVPNSDMILLKRRDLLDGDDVWTKVKFMGELILNVTVNIENSCTLVAYTLVPSHGILTLPTEGFTYSENQSEFPMVYKFSLPILPTVEGSASSSIKFYSLRAETASLIHVRNVRFGCNVRDDYNLKCILVLRSIYNNVIMKLVADNSSNVVKVNSLSCYENVSCNDDDDDWNLLSLMSITQKFSINSTCTPVGRDGKYIIALIVIVVVILTGVLFLGVVGISIFCKTKSRQRKIERQNPMSMPSEYQLENGGQNNYQEVDEAAQTSIQPQEAIPVYDHVNLNNTHELKFCANDEAGYNITQHVLQQTSTGYGGDEQAYAKLQNGEPKSHASDESGYNTTQHVLQQMSGNLRGSEETYAKLQNDELESSTSVEAHYNKTQHGLQQTSVNHENEGETYAKLQNDQNHFYHTLERDRDPRGIQVSVCAEVDSCASSSHSSPSGQPL